jgi:hypothetical protein
MQRTVEICYQAIASKVKEDLAFAVLKSNYCHYCYVEVTVMKELPIQFRTCYFKHFSFNKEDESSLSPVIS